MALVNAADGTVVANYDYGAFGELIRITGVMARNNPFRFSTKYADDESDLLYYGYRYYKPSTGTWLSKDPMEEAGGDNLNAFVGNDPISQADGRGLECVNKAKLKFGNAFEIATGVYVSWDIDGSWDKCGCCNVISGNGKIEVGIGAKFEKKVFVGVNGWGAGGSLTAEFSLAKFNAGGNFSYTSCPSDSCVDVKLPLATLTLGPTASVEVSGGLHAGSYVNISLRSLKKAV